jgi:hypothetical protein
MTPAINDNFPLLGDTTPVVWHTLDLGTHTVLCHNDTLANTPANMPKVHNITDFFPVTVVKKPHQAILHRTYADQDWIYGSFAILLLLIVLIRITWRRELTNLFRAVIFPAKGSAETRPFEFATNSFSVLFMLIYSMTFSFLFISVTNELLFPQHLQTSEMSNLFFIVALGIFALMMLKLLMAWFTARVFQTLDAGQLYRDHLLLSAFTSAAAIIPLMVVNVFTPSMIPLIMALLIMVVSIGLRLFRMIYVGTALTPFSLVHVFLYFCTLEIIPLLLIGNLLFRMQVDG